MLSHLRLRIAGEKPNLLSAVRGRDNVILTSNLTNPTLPETPASAIHLERAGSMGRATARAHLLRQLR